KGLLIRGVVATSSWLKAVLTQIYLTRLSRIPRPARTGSVLLFLVLASLLISGCHTSRTDLEAASGLEPLPPAFLSGPAGLLLTNVERFSAHVVLTSDSPEPQQNGTSGELVGRAGTLLVVPCPGRFDH